MIGWIDPVYFLFALPGLALSLWASFYTKSTFKKYSRVGSRRGMTGAQAAQELLRSNGVEHVRIEQVRGFLSDHYDPRTRTLRLSPGVYGSQSLSAIGVACHEAGHALQHAQNYAPLQLRTSLVPATMVGSNFSYVLILAGVWFHSQPLVLLGAACFSLAVLFSLVTLPVEWNATARAKRAMAHAGIVSEQEASHAGRVLNAAFLTYVAAAVSSLLILLYYLMRAGVFGGDD